MLLGSRRFGEAVNVLASIVPIFCVVYLLFWAAYGFRSHPAPCTPTQHARTRCSRAAPYALDQCDVLSPSGRARTRERTRVLALAYVLGTFGQGCGGEGNRMFVCGG